MLRIISFLLLLAPVLSLGGCLTTGYGIGGEFDKYNETFIGETNGGLRSDGTVRVTMQPSGTVCSGDWIVDPINWIRGEECYERGGSMALTCADGRQLQMFWDADNCAGGFGKGADQQGNRITLIFNEKFSRVQSRIGSIALMKKKAPDLPPMQTGGAAPGGSAKRATGTGFFVTSDGHFLTNYHVIENGRRIMVRMPDDKFVPARILREDPQNDLALGVVDTATYALPLGLTRSLRRGDDLTVLGYPQPRLQGQEQKAVFGRVNALTGAQDDITTFQMDAPVQGGNSGGPVINVYGEVVGVVKSSLVRNSAANRSVTDVHYAIKAAYVMPLLRAEDLRDKVRISGRGRKMEKADLAERLKDGVVQIIVEF